MQENVDAGTVPPEPSRRWPWWAGFLAALVIAGWLVFLNVGRWLVLENPLQKADAIAVLSGRMPNRALEAARTYKQGYADQVWLTHSTEPAAALARLSIDYLGEESYSKQILMHEGVPESAIHVLDPPIVNTADEVRVIGQALRKERQHTVIVVTSKVHTRRVRALWNRIAATNGSAIIRGVSDDSFDPAHWWRTTTDVLDVVREILGIANAWAGLPLRPSP